MRFVGAAKNAGYPAHLLFSATRDPAINAYRVARRYMEGGHPIPVNVIVDRYYQSMGNLSRSLGDFDLAHILDNSVGDRAPTLQCVMHNNQRRLWLAHPAEHWACMAVGDHAEPLAQ
jgi:predicted ABC-type ATPase